NRRPSPWQRGTPGAIRAASRRGRALLREPDLLHELAIVPKEVLFEHDALLVPVADGRHRNLRLARRLDDLAVGEHHRLGERALEPAAHRRPLAVGGAEARRMLLNPVVGREGPHELSLAPPARPSAWGSARRPWCPATCFPRREQARRGRTRRARPRWRSERCD